MQGFTSVLWALVVALPYSLGADIYSAAMGASFVCSLGTALLLLQDHLLRRGAVLQRRADRWR